MLTIASLRRISPILMLVYTDHRISPSHLPHPNARLYWPSHLPLWRGLGGCFIKMRCFIQKVRCFIKVWCFIYKMQCLIHKIQCSKSLYWPLHLPYPNAHLF